MKIFGAALDALPHPEKVALKRAYLRAVNEGRAPESDPADPYDALRPLLLENSILKDSHFAGKFEIESAITPKPMFEDYEKITSDNYFNFLDGGGCERVARDLKTYVKRDISPSIPAVMIGVDHSLTAGSVMALSEKFGAENLTLIVFDGHFDAVGAKFRAAAFESILGKSSVQKGADKPELSEAFTCETFLNFLLENKWILPQNLIVIGAYDYPNEKLRNADGSGIRRYCGEYLKFESEGVTIIPRDAVRERPEVFVKAINEIETDYLYVSLDLDVAASAENPAVRFHDSTGLTAGELYHLTDCISQRLREGKTILAGADVMEMDIHLIDVRPREDIENRTLEIATGFLRTLLTVVSKNW